MKIHSRASWGAAAPKSKSAVSRSQRTAFMVHHEAAPPPATEAKVAAALRDIQRFHQRTRGWADIGYNFVVDPFGGVWEGRGWDVLGAHCTGWNTAAVGVCVLGDYTTAEPTRASVKALRDLYATACKRFGRTLRVMGHRDGLATACPGDRLYAIVHAGLGGGSAGSSSTATTSTDTGTHAPAFPLPAGSYFGPRSGPASSVSGYYSHRDDLRRWQAQAIARGDTPAARLRSHGGADGLYGPATAAAARIFQEAHGLTVDGLIGPDTWPLPWTRKKGGK